MSNNICLQQEGGTEISPLADGEQLANVGTFNGKSVRLAYVVDELAERAFVRYLANRITGGDAAGYLQRVVERRQQGARPC